jgi:hypothetical protein
MKSLRNVRHCETEQGLRVYSNSGFQDTHMIRDLPGFGPVWYNKGSLASILSLAAIRKICHISHHGYPSRRSGETYDPTDPIAPNFLFE